jgi:hypothetical protein
MQPARYKLPLQQNNQAALRDERLPERELCAFRLPLPARALVLCAREVVVRLLRPELTEREPPDAERLLFVRALAVRELLRLRPVVERELPPRAVVPRLLLRFRPEERELLAAVERERVPELRRVLLEPSCASVERLRLRPIDSFCLAVSRLTSLLKRLLGSASNRNARLFSSNLRKKSSQEISSRVPSPLNPGKSMRRMPGSPPFSVDMTVAGTPPRSSAHRRISS